MPPPTRYADSGDGWIAYQIVGPDEPVDGVVDLVYMTGATTHVDVRWEGPRLARFFSRLASFSRLILFDRRGSGASDPLPVDTAGNWEAWMEDLRVVLEAAHSERAALMATTDGGPTGLMFAAAYPERTRALILGNTSARPLVAADYPIGLTVQAVDEFVQLTRDTWGTPAYAAVLAPGLVGADLEWFAKLQRASLTPRAAGERLHTDLQADMRSVLPAIRTPTLVLHARDFALLGLDHGRYLVEHIDGAKLVVLDTADGALSFGSGPEVGDAVEEFLTGTLRTTDADRMLATVVFTDLVGSTAQAASAGDKQWRQTLERHDAVSRAVVQRFGGRTWKSTGDGVMASFDAPGRAIRCVKTLQEELCPLGLEIRAGIHAGEVEVREGDISGLAVHIAARVLDAARDGGVMVSRTVADLVAGSGLELLDCGVRSLRGVPGEWSLFLVG